MSGRIEQGLAGPSVTWMLTWQALRLEAWQEQRELVSGRHLPVPSVLTHPSVRIRPSCSEMSSALITTMLAQLFFWLLGEAGALCHLSPLPETLPQPSPAGAGRGRGQGETSHRRRMGGAPQGMLPQHKATETVLPALLPCC